MFEKAAKLKLRFDTDRGSLTTEDLYDLPLTSKSGFDLDTIARSVNREIKATDEESFVNTNNSSKSSIHNLKLDILKHIIASKIEDAKTREDFFVNKERNEKILKIIADKQDESLQGKSIEELQALIK